MSLSETPLSGAAFHRDDAHVRAVMAARPGGFPVAVAAPADPGRPGLRRVAAIVTPQITITIPAGGVPRFAEVNPSDLLVDETYQRALSKGSVKLIRRIVSNWDWRKFKPPVVAKTVAGLEVLDGQHTAIAAATHPAIHRIPVMIVEAGSLAQRAAAFVGHNQERVNLTQMQLHAGASAAGNAEATALNEVCAQAGVKVLKYIPSGGAFKARETVAIGAISALLKRRGPEGARHVLEVLAQAECAPVASGQIKAVDLILHDEMYAGQVERAALVNAIVALGAVAERDAAMLSAAKSMPQWRALAVVYFRRSRKRRTPVGDA